MNSSLQARELDYIFQALADATRREIISLVSTQALSISDIAAKFTISFAAVSKHIKVLEKAGLLNRKQEGRVHYLSLNPERLMSANEWIAHYESFWTDQLNSLKDFVEKD